MNEAMLPSHSSLIDQERLVTAQKIIITAAIADFVQAGMCNDTTSLAAVLHGPRLQGIDMLEIPKSVNQGRAWARTEGILPIYPAMKQRENLI